MKHHHWIAISVSLIVCAAGPAALAKGQPAAKPPKDPKLPPSAESAQVFAKYDLDHSGTLNVEEAAAIASAFQLNPNDPILKPFDTNHDGKLSDKEIMAIPSPNPPPKRTAKKK